jgi:hypothetical protein
MARAAPPSRSELTFRPLEAEAEHQISSCRPRRNVAGWRAISPRSALRETLHLELH